LVDVLRARVKVHVHCYETVDLDAIVRLTNEFQFPIAAFHHAHEAYLGTGIVKRAWGEPPALAIFATNARYKREAYRGSEFAARILADEGLRVIMKSDHPVLDSRFLLYEAQQAHHYGLDWALALSAVTTTPAHVLSLDHRLGFVRNGYDADLTIWDSHPLSLGSTPLQVFIDGIPQIQNSTAVMKHDERQNAPEQPDFSKERADALKYDGLPPLSGRSSRRVLFINVAGVWTRNESRIMTSTSSPTLLQTTSVMVVDGQIFCVGARCTNECSSADVIDLQGGWLSPGLITYGADIGLEEIRQEDSTNDGQVSEFLDNRIPKLLGGDGTIIRASDGLKFGGRDMLLAYRAGVTTAITAPMHSGFMAGLGTSFSLRATNRLEAGAVIQEATALHIAIHSGRDVSVSSQIAALRSLLSGKGTGDSAKWFQKVAKGEIPLVVEVESADIMANLLHLKAEVEEASGVHLKFTFSGASEAHLLAGELATAGVGVVLRPARPFPTLWESRRIMPGPPLSETSAAIYLLERNVTVGIGIQQVWQARNTRFDVGWLALNSQGRLTYDQAALLVTRNLEYLLGVVDSKTDLVATRGGNIFDSKSKVVAILNNRQRAVDIFE